MTLLASPEPSATFIETNAVTIKTPDTSAQPQSPSNARPASPNAIRARATSRYAPAVGSSRLRHDMERSARLEATPRPATATMLNTGGRSQSITEAPHRRGSAAPMRPGPAPRAVDDDAASPGRISAQRRVAVAAAATHRRAARAVPRHHLAVADRAGHDVVRSEALPGSRDDVLERLAAPGGGIEQRWLCDVAGQGDGHGTLRYRPTTFPSTRTSFERIGSMVVFSGCRRTWSTSWKKRLTVASDSSPTSATTISPSTATSCGRTTTKSPSRIPASIIDSPRTRSTKSPSSPPAAAGTSTYSSMFSSARIG